MAPQIEGLQARDEATGQSIACIQDCNNTLVQVNAIGFVPSVCQANSVLRQGYERCALCVQTATANAQSEYATYLNPQFVNYLQYCDGLGKDGYAISSVTVTRSNGEITAFATTFRVAESATVTSVTSTTSVTPSLSTSEASRASQSGNGWPAERWAPIVGGFVLLLMMYVGFVCFKRRKRDAKANAKNPRVTKSNMQDELDKTPDVMLRELPPRYPAERQLQASNRSFSLSSSESRGNEGTVNEENTKFRMTDSRVTLGAGSSQVRSSPPRPADRFG